MEADVFEHHFRSCCQLEALEMLYRFAGYSVPEKAKERTTRAYQIEEKYPLPI